MSKNVFLLILTVNSSTDEVIISVVIFGVGTKDSPLVRRFFHVQLMCGKIDLLCFLGCDHLNPHSYLV